MTILLLFVLLNGPDGQVIFVNPAEVVSMRALRQGHAGHFAPGIRCVLQTVDGKVINVTDECDTVRSKLGASP